MIAQVLQAVEKIRESTGVSYAEICRKTGLSYKSLSRWRGRARKGKPLLAAPGPKKVMPLDFEKLRSEIDQLKHRTDRTHGVGELYERYESSISRRELASLIKEMRNEKKRNARLQFKSIEWLAPGVAWGTDATDWGSNKLHCLQDLASRYRFCPLESETSTGQEIAQWLEGQFERHGAPLFLKRDNGSPFNNHWVDDVLKQYGVIPLNSPPGYPQYNGQVERFMRELHEHSDRYESLDYCIDALNAHPRPCLQGESAVRVLMLEPARRFSKRRRHEIFEWITTQTAEIIKTSSRSDSCAIARAWRQSVETWLRCQGLIKVRQNKQEVLPHFLKKCAQN